MLFTKVVTPLALWAWTATAFYPLVTEEHCVQVGGCLGPSLGATKVVPTVKVKQRHSRNDLPHNIRISRYLDRLTQKYQATAVSKRANKYPISFSNTPTQANSVAIDQDGTDFSYFATVNFGSGATPMYMLLDTGASNTWVMGKDCTNDACQNHNTFDSSSSSTFKAHSNGFSLFYGSGDVSGSWASDSLSVADLELTMDFGVANSTSPEFLNFPFDGILGLATAANDYPSFLVALQNAKLLKANMFGMNLNRGSDGTNDGEMTFGALDSSKFTGDIGYSDLSRSDGTWAIKCDGIALGGKDSGIPARNASIDTGTSYIFMSSDDAKAFHSPIKGASLSQDGVYWQVPCNGQSDIQLTFNGNTYTVPTEDWVGVPTTADPSLCISNIYPGTPVEGFLFGDTFLKNVYSIYDYDQKRIGFANKPTASTSATSAGPSPQTTSSILPSTSGPESTSSISFTSGSGSGATSSSTLETNALGTVTSSASSTSMASTASGTGTSGGFDAAVTSKTSSPNSASETAGTSASPTPSTTATGASSRFSVNVVTASLILLVAITFG